MGGLIRADAAPLAMRAGAWVEPVLFVVSGGGVIDPSSLFGDGVRGAVPCLLIDSMCMDISPLNLGACREAGLLSLRSESSSSSYARVSTVRIST
jgi:hypothetical protein